MKERLYSIGEIFRGKMLLDSRGQPYAGDKSQIAKVVRKMRYTVVDTPWGPSKAVPMSEIKKHNDAQTSSPRRN